MKPKDGLFSGRYSREFIEVICPTCKLTKIICVPKESIPKCERCHKDMIIKEILTEGKY
ncbi:hypothetical protein [Desulfovibrio cuneatus]|uniref:hypothetical protein n=1 Tax=Desulfovibrio cuneatus TaxID=159728 RepID=UPI0004261752|nr:hypothetical protein [Desulfovibrio cuneatus]